MQTHTHLTPLTLSHKYSIPHTSPMHLTPSHTYLTPSHMNLTPHSLTHMPPPHNAEARPYTAQAPPTLVALSPMRQMAFIVGHHLLNSAIQLERVDFGARTRWGRFTSRMWTM